MAHNFNKIYAPFGRKGPKDKLVDSSIYSRNWVQSFMDNNVKMWASEKIDGTSVGLVWDGERVSFIGHTDKSQFAPRFSEYLQNTFGTPEFESMLEQIFGERNVTLYGEGISKDYNQNYGYPEGNFIMYDIQGDKGTFFQREAVKDIAGKLNLTYPFETQFTIQEAVDYVKTRPASYLDPNLKMEGLVLRAPIELYTNNNERIICKVKVCDFIDVKNYNS